MKITKYHIAGTLCSVSIAAVGMHLNIDVWYVLFMVALSALSHLFGFDDGLNSGKRIGARIASEVFKETVQEHVDAAIAATTQQVPEEPVKHHCGFLSN